ncbi:MAG: hypothetical protein U1F76_17300 [Candidatus Competibacteraceae bacterium]
MTATQITPAEWQLLTRKRVVFGHQSVGQNILDGLQSLAAQNHIDLTVKKSREPVNSNGIFHFFVGDNGNPAAKFKDFTDTLESGMAQQADIALLKLCYIDFTAATDAQQIAGQYISTLDRLSREFPHTTFIAVTTPLTTLQTGPKAWVKRLLGRQPSGYADNARRQEFNELLRLHYGPQGRLFDLARIETGSAGEQRYQGRPLEVLDPMLAADEGHLNPHGEKVVAERFIKFLATLPRS